MGHLFSFLKKSKGTKEQLEDIQNEIDKIEEYKISVFVKKKNYMVFLIIASVLAYIIGVFNFYINYCKNFRYNVLWALFFILSTSVIYFAKKFIRFYFKWVNDANNIKLVAMIKRKKRIISKVQETETFNDAKSIIERYDPSALQNFQLRQQFCRTVKPILPRNRSVVKKMVDYVFSDGPSNRYGLICAQCHSHNSHYNGVDLQH